MEIFLAVFFLFIGIFGADPTWVIRAFWLAFGVSLVQIEGCLPEPPPVPADCQWIEVEHIWPGETVYVDADQSGIHVEKGALYTVFTGFESPIEIDRFEFHPKEGTLDAVKSIHLTRSGKDQPAENADAIEVEGTPYFDADAITFVLKERHHQDGTCAEHWLVHIHLIDGGSILLAPHAMCAKVKEGEPPPNLVKHTLWGYNL